MTTTFTKGINDFDGIERWGKVVRLLYGNTWASTQSQIARIQQLKRNNNGEVPYDVKKTYVTDLYDYTIAPNRFNSDQTNYTVHYHDEGFEEPQQTNECKVLFVKRDTLDVAEAFGHHDDCLILNFANSVDVGGSFNSGATTQEETLIYRSTYYHSLHKAFQNLSNNKQLDENDFDVKSQGFALHGKAKYLPFRRCIVSPNVYVYGRIVGDKMTLNPNEPIMKVSMIAAAAPCLLKLPRKNSWYTKGRLNTNIQNAIVTMWETIFRSAIAEKKRNLIIGPIGCGAYAPKKYRDEYVKLMAVTLNKVIDQYKKFFQTIIFADFSQSNNKTYETFLEQLKNSDPQEIELTQLGNYQYEPNLIPTTNVKANLPTQTTSPSQKNPRTNSSQTTHTSPRTNQTPNTPLGSTRQSPVFHPITRASQPTSAYLLFAAFVSTFIVSTIRVSMV